MDPQRALIEKWMQILDRTTDRSDFHDRLFTPPSAVDRLAGVVDPEKQKELDELDRRRGLVIALQGVAALVMENEQAHLDRLWRESRLSTAETKHAIGKIAQRCGFPILPVGVDEPPTS